MIFPMALRGLLKGKMMVYMLVQRGIDASSVCWLGQVCGPMQD